MNDLKKNYAAIGTSNYISNNNKTNYYLSYFTMFIKW